VAPVYSLAGRGGGFGWSPPGSPPYNPLLPQMVFFGGASTSCNPLLPQMNFLGGLALLCARTHVHAPRQGEKKSGDRR
jgi:hypothetical protein